ncbi:hypothetical protein PENTCL1PPCAC_23265, partial [Pristionchus entomophagus]
ISSHGLQARPPDWQGNVLNGEEKGIPLNITMPTIPPMKLSKEERGIPLKITIPPMKLPIMELPNPGKATTANPKGDEVVATEGDQPTPKITVVDPLNSGKATTANPKGDEVVATEGDQPTPKASIVE